MKFPMDRPGKVVMLGAGGTGGYVAPYVFRLLHMLGRPARFIICDGDIVEQGTHEELMAKKGHYYTLYTRQFEQEAVEQAFS